MMAQLNPMKSDIKILLALTDRSFMRRATIELKRFYKVYTSAEINDFSKKVHDVEFDLIVIDYRFSGMKAEDVYSSVQLFHPNAVFVIYTKKEKRDIAERLWKRRALDYIYYTDKAFPFCENIHKAVRWTISNRQGDEMNARIKKMEETIRDLEQKLKP